MKFLKFMGVFVLTIVLLWLWNQGILVSLTPTAFKYRALSEKYGGVYVFYPEFREEIKQRERERKELFEKIKDEISSNPREIKNGDGTTKIIYDTDFTRINETLPQTLSNGCKYYNQAFGPYREYFEPYYEKIKEFVGEKDYEKLKPFLTTTSFYRCGEGEKVIITLYTIIGFNYRIYGLFGDEGRGFSLSRVKTFEIGGDNTFELRNGKFEKVDKEFEGLR